MYQSDEGIMHITYMFFLLLLLLLLAWQTFEMVPQKEKIFHEYTPTRDGTTLTIIRLEH